MIKLNNVNKYFNHRKRNEVHVLKDANICLFEQGFVAITGPSGSGKTTLLNVLCGLDKTTSGEITIADTTITRYKSRKWDFLRNKYFGYIFQNYNIFYTKTVFENVALALELLGIKDKNLIEQRVIEALSIVKMEKYRNRLANSLSGGEQQRVAIARAVVKDPKIIIADEPTGNLDEKNTINIMNILKSISKDRLVILVTHEKELATFYADRIVQIADGEIHSDLSNDTNDQLVRYETHEIYLKELEGGQITEDGNVSVIKYSDSETTNKVDIKVVFKGNNVFLSINSPNSQVKILNEFSEVKMIDDYKPVVTRENLDVDGYKISSLEEYRKGRYAIPFLVHLRDGFKSIFKLSGFKKLMMFCFLLPATLLVAGISLWQGVSTVYETDFLNFDRNLIKISRGEEQSSLDAYDDFMTLLSQDNVKGYLSSRGSFLMSQNDYLLQYHYPRDVLINSSIIPYNYVEEYPSSATKPLAGEVVIDRYIADQIINRNYVVAQYSYGNIAVTDSMLKNQYITLPNSYTFKIVDIVDLNNGSVYINPADWGKMLNSGVYRFSDELRESTYDVKALKDNEIIVDETETNEKIYIYGKEYMVVGTHKSYGSYGVSENTKIFVDFMQNIDMYNEYYLYVDDIENFEPLHDETIRWENVYQTARKVITDMKKLVYRIVLSIALGLMAIPLVFLYFAQRANLFARQKEIGIYRALGMNKSGIYKMSLGEIMSMTIMYSIPGYLLGLYIVNQLCNSIAGALFSNNWIVVLGSLLITIGINIIIGIIPTIRLLAKTPREILISTDM